MPQLLVRPSSLQHSLITAVISVGLLTACSAPATDDTAATDSRIRIAQLLAPGAGLSPFSDDAFKMTRVGTFENLVTLDSAGDLQPKLATAWEQVDDSSWRFTIRTGVKYHDGTDLTPANVATALNAANKAMPKPRVLDGTELTAVADDTTVTVSSAEPDPLLAQKLTSPQLVILAPTAYLADGTVAPLKAGTGPFVFSALSGTTSATFDRFDQYWGGHAALSGIDVDFVTDANTRLTALRTGTADIVEGLSRTQTDQLTEDQYHLTPTARSNMIYLNTATGPFADPAVRAAANDAIDVDAIIATIYDGKADRADGLLGPAVEWAAALRDTPEYQRPRGPQVAAAPVSGTEITLATFTDRGELPDVAALVAQQLQAAGFVVKQDIREYQYLEADALAGAFDVFIQSRGTVIDSGDPLAFMTADFSCDGSYNITQLCDPAVDERLTAAAPLVQGDERRAAIMHAEATVLGTGAVIPFAHPLNILGIGAGVQNLVFDPRDREMITIQTTLSGG